ncbi:MAG: HD domain-containing phosphohydrolase [bacterium]
MSIKGKILIVDDEHLTSEFIQTFLQTEGYEISAEATGELALAKLRKETFDCLLVDLNLPGINGIEVLQEIRKVNEDICVIIMTGYATIESAILAMKAGASDYICKPFLDLRQIIISIEKTMNNQSLVITNRTLLNDLGRINEKLQNTVDELTESSKYLKKIYVASYASLAAAIDARDKYTSGHSEKVAEYALFLGRLLQLSPQQLEDLEHACRFHDIGKIAIPDSILLKKGRLTAEEWVVMKQHPLKGAKILEPLSFIMKNIIDIVKYHHEQYNGEGYPEGLKGKDIPYLARVVSLADAFEAMVAGRQYQKRIPKAGALKNLEKGAGAHFDPQLVELFISAVEGE